MAAAVTDQQAFSGRRDLRSKDSFKESKIINYWGFFFLNFLFHSGIFTSCTHTTLIWEQIWRIACPRNTVNVHTLSKQTFFTGCILIFIILFCFLSGLFLLVFFFFWCITADVLGQNTADNHPIKSDLWDELWNTMWFEMSSPTTALLTV